MTEADRLLELAAQIAEAYATCGCNGTQGHCYIDDAPKAIAAEIRALTRAQGDKDHG